MDSRAQHATYSIKQVIDLTGISEFSLRGWEQRHSALRPKRNPSGRRIYTDQDILKVKLLIDLVGRGHKIGKIAKLEIDELNALLDPGGTIHDTRSQAHLFESEGKAFARKIFKLANQFDWGQIRKIFRQTKKKSGDKIFIYQYLLPFISEMNSQISKGHFSITQEHLLSALIKEQLLSNHATIKNPSNLRMILTSVDGDFHDLGLQIAAALLRVNRVDALFLGASMPKRDLCQTALKYKATHILITSTISPSVKNEDLLEYIHYLDSHLPRTTHLWFAGRNTDQLNIKLRRPFHILRSFESLEEAIRDSLSH